MDVRTTNTKINNDLAAQLVSETTRAQFTSLETLLKSDNNFKKLRKALADATPPCIPYVGMALTDLVFLEGTSHIKERWRAIARCLG